MNRKLWATFNKFGLDEQNNFSFKTKEYEYEDSAESVDEVCEVPVALRTSDHPGDYLEHPCHTHQSEQLQVHTKPGTINKTY